MEYVLGVFVSIVVQGIKKYFGTDEYVTICVVAVLSLVSAGVYIWLVNAGLWEAFAKILITAGAFYAFIIMRFQGAQGPGNSNRVNFMRVSSLGSGSSI